MRHTGWNGLKKKIVLWTFCLASFVGLTRLGMDLVFGQSDSAAWSGWKSTSLSDIELNELAGVSQIALSATTDPGSTGPRHSPLQWVAETLHLPFIHPWRLLEYQLPSVNARRLPQDGSQSSLLSSIFQWQPSSHKIALGWMPQESAAESDQLILDNPGMNVVSPTWLELGSSRGDITGRIQNSVVRFAHQHHVQVWVLITNQFRSNLTSRFLSSSNAENHFIKQLKTLVVEDRLNGINLDFENMDSADQAAYTSFVGKLDRTLTSIHADLSVDVTPDIVPLVDNSAYFHAGLAANCHQLILMAYDEHWGGDSVAGPVASLPWVRQSVQDLLDTGVPADKLVLGVPFYTRFWHMHPQGYITSEAVALDMVPNILTAHHAKASYDSSLGLMYARYPVASGYEQVWFASKKTLQTKLQMVNNDGLAGVAVWSLPLSAPSTWKTLVDQLRQSIA
ncbi:MAG: glycosyl hydrolase family 18 protein [Alicyclobacillaceae bacterium]|nr:glycosyl hydrolase family 18 protein [Alicyclobacillaceae bacterium]